MATPTASANLIAGLKTSLATTGVWRVGSYVVTTFEPAPVPGPAGEDPIQPATIENVSVSAYSDTLGLSLTVVAVKSGVTVTSIVLSIGVDGSVLYKTLDTAFFTQVLALGVAFATAQDAAVVAKLAEGA